MIYEIHYRVQGSCIHSGNGELTQHVHANIVLRHSVPCTVLPALNKGWHHFYGKNLGDIMITFDEVINYDNLLKSYFHCRKGKAYRQATVKYHMEYMVNISKLLKRLREGSYEIKSLYSFVIYEPKKRNITANRFEDKIVQRVICKYALEPAIQPRLIFDNYASQPNKGNHLAIGRLKKFMISFAKENDWSDEGWVLTCDVKKYFYTIDRTICYKMVEKLDLDDRLKAIIHKQITALDSSYNEYTDEPNKGLCIGFQTSQWLAVYYMSELDHFIKEKLHIKYYGRYMDDFYMIHKDRKYLEYCLKEINRFVETRLDLKLNDKTHIHPFKQGICFLGYHCTYDVSDHTIHTTIRSKSVRKMKKRTRLQTGLIKIGKIEPENALDSIRSWHAYAVHGESTKAINAHKEAYNMVLPYIQTKKEHIKMLEDIHQIDNDGFIVLKYREDFYDPNGIIKKPHYNESMVEMEERLHREEVLANQDLYTRKNIYTLTHINQCKAEHKKRNSSKNKKKNQMYDVMDETMLRLAYPDDPPKKKKKSKKELWADLDQYRDEEGFIELVRRK